MKRICSLLLLLTFFSLPAFTQILNLKPGVAFSHVDYSLYHVQGKVNQFTSPVRSYSFMLDLEYLEEKKISLTSGFHLYNSGGQFSDEELLNAIHEPVTKVSFHYASAYTTLNYNPLNKRIRFQLQAGPRIDVLTSSNMDEIWDGMKENIPTYNYALNAGGGLYYISVNHQIGINAFYLFRLKKTLDIENPSFQWLRFMVEENNAFLSISLGWKLG